MNNLFVKILLVVCVVLAAFARNDNHKQDVNASFSPGHDQEGILGKEEMEKFAKLSMKERKQELGELVDEIDKDDDGKVSEDELKEWLALEEDRRAQEESDIRFEHFDLDNDMKVTWDEYFKVAYDDDDDDDADDDDEEEKKSIEKDKKRFEMADADDDGYVTMDEFRAFLSPEDYDYTKNLVAKEILEKADKNKDGVIDLNEYLEGTFDDDDDDDDDEGPKVVAEKGEHFAQELDINKDGKLDLDDIIHWIDSEDDEEAEEEAEDLIKKADDNNDGELSLEEILAHQAEFVGSEASDKGEAEKSHDEF